MNKTLTSHFSWLFISQPKSFAMKKFTGTNFLIYSLIFLVASCKDLPDPPIASFTISTNLAEIGDTIYFINTSLDADTYNWDFGDGGTSTIENPYHIYSEVGIYRIEYFLGMGQPPNYRSFYSNIFIVE